MNSSRVICTIVLLLTFCFSFTNQGHTQDVLTFCSSDVPVTIPPVGQAPDSILNVPDVGEIVDVVVKLQIEHPFREDLEVELSSPETTEILLFDDVGGTGDDFGTTCEPMPNFILDDSASESVVQFSTGDPAAGTYRPLEPLSTFVGEDGEGQWSLSIFDSDGTFGGTLTCWCLEFRSTPSAVRSIPTIGQWGMIAFAGILGVMGALFLHIRRKRAAV